MVFKGAHTTGRDGAEGVHQQCVCVEGNAGW